MRKCNKIGVNHHVLFQVLLQFTGNVMGSGWNFYLSFCFALCSVEMFVTRVRYPTSEWRKIPGASRGRGVAVRRRKDPAEAPDTRPWDPGPDHTRVLAHLIRSHTCWDIVAFLICDVNTIPLFVSESLLQAPARLLLPRAMGHIRESVRQAGSLLKIPQYHSSIPCFALC